MADHNDQRGQQVAATRRRDATRTSAATAKTSARRTVKEAENTAREASGAVSTESKAGIAQAQQLAERAVMVPVGAGLVARDNLVSTVKGFASKYRTRASLERELKRYERRGTTARDRVERQVRGTRIRFERELHQRRGSVERAVGQNRRRLEREVRAVRRDLEKQSGTLAARVEKIVSRAPDRASAS
jgi:hypothetical protein